MISTKELIFNTSAKLFRKKGYSATTVLDIATEIGIKPASLYNHIKSKQELLQRMLMEIAHAFVAGLKEIQESSLNPYEKVEHIIGLHVRLTFSSPDKIALLTGEWVHLESPAISDFLVLRDGYEDDFKAILDQCVEQGYFEDVNVEIALFSILSTLRWAFIWIEKHPEFSPIDLEKQLIKSLIKGLAK